jgi:endogenous inhibitor of DNA gyrase (YacG/DUF329 family)
MVWPPVNRSDLLLILMIYKCPTCKKHIKSPESQDDDSGRFLPFCSERCRLIDLGAWLDGAYKISTPVEQKDEGAPQETPGKV